METRPRKSPRPNPCEPRDCGLPGEGKLALIPNTRKRDAMTHAPRTPLPSCLAVGFLILTTCSLSRAQGPRPGTPKPGEPPEQAVVRALNEAWPDHPEWLDEYTAILQDT